MSVVGLPRGSRRAYGEARYRLEHGGATSSNWRGSEQDVRIWMNAMVLAAEDNIGPWDALLLAVKRRSARVHWTDNIVEHLLAQHRQRCAADPDYGDPDVPPAEARRWLAESREEERLMTRAAKMAVDAGVADAMIRRVKREGQIMTDALVAGLDVLELSPEDRFKALQAMHTTISAAFPSTNSARTLEG